MSHNLDATVFVYQSRIDGRIQAEYLDTAKVMEDSPDWEHLDTIEPRMWIQVHYDYAGKMIAAGNRMAAMLDTSLTAPIEEWPDEAEIDAALKEWRFAVDPCPLADDGKGIDAPPQPKPNATVPALNDADSVDCPRCGHCCPDDTALLMEAMSLLMQMPIKHPQQGEYRYDLIRRIRERLK
jgi:hypothetical protein